MRRIRREKLPPAEAQKLRTEQARVNARRRTEDLDVNAVWNRARRNKPLKVAYSVLLEMAGKRERCMYCGDSQGTDIEHFWPKSAWPGKMFRWKNLLLGCTACGRDHKGSQFPLDAAKRPLLIDPTAMDPWLFLDFDPQTGNVVPRYDAQGNPAPEGKATVEVLGFDRRESLAAGHQRTYRGIVKCITAATRETPTDSASLIAALKEADEYGLLGWCFRGSGTAEPPMTTLREAQPALWTACVRAFRSY